MAESQLACLEDGTVEASVPASRAEFYYSEEQRGAVEELLRNGDSAFKTRLQADDMKDFLSAREVKLLISTFRRYDTGEEPAAAVGGGGAGTPARSSEVEAESALRSTYWPQMSDTEVPVLDLGWTGGGLFRGVTRVAVHTHPPKGNGPHVREVVRRLIQEANKVIAIVMDMLTDPHILQDLLDAASRRSVPVYMLLNKPGVPHFLDMCNRLQIGLRHLKNIRARVLEGTGLGLPFGRIPGSLCHKYMLVDGDKVMFGSYSFSWCTSRMDRNMITVMSGQVVDIFDQDFRELYAVSEKLDLYKEFHVNPPTDKNIATPTKSEIKRPFSPATTSRFQVSLGDSPKADIQVPAHKYYNPKYLLVTGELPRSTGSLKELTPNMRQAILADVSEEINPERLQLTSSEKMDRLSPLPSEGQREILKETNSTPGKKGMSSFRIFLSRKTSRRLPVSSPASSTCPSPTPSSHTDMVVNSKKSSRKSPFKSKKQTEKKSQCVASEPAINSSQDNESQKSHQCTIS